MDLNEDELETLDLADRYDEDIHTYTTLRWKDYALLYAVCAIVLTFIAWASFFTVDELARGIGKVIPSSEVQIIQNLEGGIIDKFYVSEGDVVEQNQLLVRISNVQADSEYQANLKRYQSLQAELIRLDAETKGVTPEFPADLVQAAPDAVLLETANYQAGSLQRESQMDILEQQYDQRRQGVEEVREKMEGARRVLTLTQEEYDMIQPLVARETVSKVELLQLQSRMAGMEAELNNLTAALNRTKSAMKEAEERLQEFRSTSRAEAQQKIALKTAELTAVRETLASYKDRATRTEIRAPVYGTVKDIKITTIGGVVRPGESIMEIVPLDDQLIIEAMVSPASIAFLRPGLEGIIKITAYDYEIYGGLQGRVQEISADTLENERGEHFYRIKVQSDETALHHNGEDLPIIPGMVASVDILTGKKTIMNYLLSPFKKTVRNALHEK